MTTISRAQIDSVIDSNDDDRIAQGLGDLLDATGEWDWSDGSDHDPSDRLAVLGSSGAWWLVYRGTEGDEATCFATEHEAQSALVLKSELWAFGA